MSPKLLSRAVLVAVTLLVAICYYVPAGHVNFVEAWGEGTFGVQLPTRGTRIAGVDPGSPAARAGVRAGDRLVVRDWRELSRFGSPYAGSTETYAIERDGIERAVTLTAVPVTSFGAWQRAGGLLALLPPTIFLIVAFVLVFIRPSVMMWSFYVFAVGYFGTLPPFEYWAHVLPLPAYLVLTFVLVTICGSWSVMALLPFVLRFPSGDLEGWRKKFDKFVWLLLAIAFAFATIEFRQQMTNGTLPWWSFYTDDLLPLFTFGIATLVLAKNYAVATPADRRRYGFLIVGTVASFVAYAVYFVPGVPFAVGQVVGFGVVLMPVCVAYAVFRLRVIDINFVLNRALVYSTISLGVVAFVSLLDFFSSQAVSIGRFALPIELVATIAIGFLLDRINKWVERAVEAIFFRARRNAEAFVRRAAKALPYATQESAISDGLVDVPAEALKLSAAALYRRTADGHRYEGIATSAATPVAPPGFDADELLVRMLASDERRMWLDEVRSHLDAANSAIYVIAVPVTVRHQLVSFTLYGAHSNGAQLDPDEVELLEELAREASRAYDHVEAVRVRERYARFTLDRPETA